MQPMSELLKAGSLQRIVQKLTVWANDSSSSLVSELWTRRRRVEAQSYLFVEWKHRQLIRIPNASTLQRQSHNRAIHSSASAACATLTGE